MAESHGAPATAGLQVYLVGGAVRDRLLDLPVAERDWLVVGSTPQALEAAGFIPLDQDFPVFLHPQTHEEYALARRERKAGHGYKGFVVDSGPEVTLEQDLARRDLTINAIAEAPDGTLHDPFGGLEDIEQGMLRHVTPAFVEDPVRLLRIARMASRLGHAGFRVAHGTQALLRRMVAAGEHRHLRPERVWKEMRRALAERQPWRFIEVLHSCGALDTLLPPLAAQLAREHADAGPPAGHGRPALPSLRALQCLAGQDDAVPARLAALLLPALAALDRPEQLRQWLPVERECLELLRVSARLQPDYAAMHQASPAQWLDWLQAGAAFRQPAVFLAAVSVCAARSAPGEDPSPAALARALLTALDGVSVADLAAAGAPRETLPTRLRQRREQAIASCLAAAPGTGS